MYKLQLSNELMHFVGKENIFPSEKTWQFVDLRWSHISIGHFNISCRVEDGFVIITSGTRQEFIDRIQMSKGRPSTHDDEIMHDPCQPTCAVCWVNEPDLRIVLCPCAHHGFCQTCCFKIELTREPNCPICRSPIERLLRTINVAKE